MTTSTAPPTDTPRRDALNALLEHLDQFQRRVVQEALADALPAYWLRRAEAFENARPRFGDSHKNVPVDELRMRDRRCAAIAQACRDKAALATEWRLL